MIATAGAATDTGLLRAHNEDRYWMDPERGLFLVVDGVGEILTEAVNRVYANFWPKICAVSVFFKVSKIKA